MIMNTKIGDRVGAISHGDPQTKIIYFYGYGVYEGYQVRPIDNQPGLFGLTFRELAERTREAFMQAYPNNTQEEIDKAVNNALLNPRIRLDSGAIIWGCQCWWGGEDKIKKVIEQYQANDYTIEIRIPGDQ